MTIGVEQNVVQFEIAANCENSFLVGYILAELERLDEGVLTGK